MPRILVLVFVLAEVNFRCAPSSACERDDDRCVEASETDGTDGTDETEGDDTGEAEETGNETASLDLGSAE